MRLQALCRSRILTAQFNAQRSLVINLQRYCRGFLVRKWAQQRMFSIIKMQAHIRAAIQRTKFRRLRIEVGINLLTLLLSLYTRMLWWTLILFSSVNVVEGIGYICVLWHSWKNMSFSCLRSRFSCIHPIIIYENILHFVSSL